MSIRIPVNLATEPFRRDRPIIVGAVALSLVLVGVLAVQAYTIWSERNQAADTRLFLDRLNKQMRIITSEQQKLDMTVAAKESTSILELVQRLESSPQFSDYQLLSTLPASQTEPFVRTRMSVSY